MDITLTTLPDVMERVEVRTLMLGGGVSGKISYIVEMEENPEDPDDMLVTLTLSNGPAVETQEQAVAQHIELLSAVLDALKEAADGF